MVLLASLAVVLVAACGARTKAEQDKDGRVLGDAIKTAESRAKNEVLNQ
jgi:uncharacterized lipoprotein